MQSAVARGRCVQGLDLEEPGSGGAASDLFLSGFPNGFHFQAQAQGNVGQRVIAIQYDML